MKKTDHSNNSQLAIALVFDGINTPKVTASGEGRTGEEIIRIAKQNDIPLKEDEALAKALSSIPLGEDIPKELYLAVAEVLAYVYFLEEVQYSYGPDETYGNVF